MSSKSILISTRFSEDELASIEARSSVLGLKVSTFVRASTLLYIERNPEIPYKDSKHVYGVDEDKAVVKNPTSFRVSEQQQKTLAAYLKLTRAKKSSLVRFATVLACSEAIETLQELPSFRPAIAVNRETTAIISATRHCLASCRLEAHVLAELNKRAASMGVSRSEYMEKAILAALEVV